MQLASRWKVRILWCMHMKIQQQSFYINKYLIHSTWWVGETEASQSPQEKFCSAIESSVNNVRHFCNNSRENRTFCKPYILQLETLQFNKMNSFEQSCKKIFKENMEQNLTNYRKLSENLRKTRNLKALKVFKTLKSQKPIKSHDKSLKKLCHIILHYSATSLISKHSNRMKTNAEMNSRVVNNHIKMNREWANVAWSRDSS